MILKRCVPTSMHSLDQVQSLHSACIHSQHCSHYAASSTLISGWPLVKHLGKFWGWKFLNTHENPKPHPDHLPSSPDTQSKLSKSIYISSYQGILLLCFNNLSLHHTYPSRKHMCIILHDPEEVCNHFNAEPWSSSISSLSLHSLTTLWSLCSLKHTHQWLTTSQTLRQILRLENFSTLMKTPSPTQIIFQALQTPSPSLASRYTSVHTRVFHYSASNNLSLHHTYPSRKHMWVIRHDPEELCTHFHAEPWSRAISLPSLHSLTTL